MMTMIEKGERDAFSPQLSRCCEFRTTWRQEKEVGPQKRHVAQTFPEKKKRGNNSDQRDNLKIGLKTSRTATVGPEIRSAEPGCSYCHTG